MWSVIVLIFLFLNCPVLCQNPCNPEVELKCPETRFTYYVYNQVFTYTLPCPNSQITDMFWYMHPKKVPDKGYVFPNAKIMVTLPANKYKAGEYILKVVVKESNGGKTTKECNFAYYSEPPILKFEQGFTQYVTDGEMYLVDIRQSKFFDTKRAVNWDVTCTPAEKFDDCSNATCKKFKANELKIKQIANRCYPTVLYKAFVNYRGQVISKSQKILVEEKDSCRVDIVCETNCDLQDEEKSDPKVTVSLKLVPANEHCPDFYDIPPRWSMTESTGAKIIPGTLTLWDNKRRMTLNANTLSYSATYFIRAHGNFTAWQRVQTIPKVTEQQCAIIPAAGKSMETKFTVKCTQTDKHFKIYQPYTRVYQINKGERILVASSPTLEFEMMLASIKGQPLQNLEAEGSDILGNTFNYRIPPVQVDEVELTAEKIQTLTKLIKEAQQLNDLRGLDYINIFMQELAQSSMDPEIKQAHKIFMMNQLTSFVKKNNNAYEQIATMLPMFLTGSKMTNEYKSNLGSYCSSIAAAFRNSMAKSEYAKYNEKKTKEQVDLHQRCTDKLLEDAEKDEPQDEGSTTPGTTTTQAVVQNMSDSAITEDYPDYALPYRSPAEGAFRQDAIDIIRDTALGVAESLQKGEEYTMSSNYSKTRITKDEGQKLATKRMDFGDVTVIPSRKFQDSDDDDVVAIFSNYNKDMMMPTSKLSGDIVDIHFHQNNKQIDAAQYKLEFNITDEIPEFLSYEVRRPEAQIWRQIDATMNVHRVNLQRQETCVIMFKFANSNAKFNIALSINERPRMKHFEKKLSNTIVDSTMPDTLLIENPYPLSDKDCFFYMAVTPHVDMLPELSTASLVPYEIRVAAVSCITYDFENHIWTASLACKTNVIIQKEKPVVQCNCKHSSLHSIYYKSIDHRLEVEYNIEFKTIEVLNRLIFAHVAVVLMMYMIALALSLRRVPRIFGRDKIYFLADNLKNDRYCYMLIVRTGSYNDSGTTANIMVQLYGQNGKSKPHVINYPDPDCKLLQRDSVDWYILANDSHLGHIETILLWTDSIGLYPTWYCKYVSVFDLQTEQKYHFEVHSWFSVLKRHVHYHKYKRVEKPIKTDSVALSITKYFRFYYDGRHTWNMFIRDDQDLTYLERITVILSMIYTCYVLTIFLTGQPTLTLSDSFGYGRFRFSFVLVNYSILTSVINSAIHLTIVFFLRNSNHITVAGVLAIPVKYFSSKIRRNITYLLVIWITLCFVYLVVFGFWIPTQTAYIWMCVTITSLIISIIIWENVFISVQNIIRYKLGITTKLVYQFEAIINEIERQRELLFRVFGEVLLRPYFKKHYRLLTSSERAELRDVISLRQDVASLFKDMCLFLVFIIILYVVCIVQYNEEIITSNRSLRMMVKDSVYAHGQNRLEDIKTMSDIYDYLENVILPLIHPKAWYDKWYSNDAGIMADFCTKVLGIVELRQQRRTQNCTRPELMKSQRMLCSNQASAFDNAVYYIGADITPAFGLLETYNGSGYVVPLGRNLKNSQFIMNLLRQRNWIDINTKVLFIEFLTYNANANIFNAVRIIIERSPAGRILKSVQIFTVSLIYVNMYKELFSASLLLLLIIIIVVMITKRCVYIILYRHNYFRDFWNLMDILLSLLSIVLIALYFVKKQETSVLLNQLADADNNTFVSYFRVMALVRSMTIIYGILIALATLRLWKFLHFGMVFRIMERTIQKAGPQMLGLFIYQLTICLMVAIFLCPLYGATMETFRTFDVASYSLLLSSLNFSSHLPNVPLLVETINLYIVYGLFMLISLSFVKLYAITLILNLEDSKISYSNQVQSYTIQQYVVDVYRYYKEKYKRHLIGTRLRAGGLSNHNEGSVSGFVSAKADVYRYADMISMTKNKMEIMKFVSIASIKNIHRNARNSALTEEDFALMGIIIYYMFYLQQHEMELDTHIFYKIRDPVLGIYRFIPDRRLLQMQMVINKLIEGKAADINFEQKEVILHENTGARHMARLLEKVEVISKILKHIVIIGPEDIIQKNKTSE